MDEAIDEVEKLSRDERIIGLYDKEKVERKLLNSFKEEMMAKGLAEGMEKGMEKGMAQGRAEGLKEGMAEGITKGKKELTKEIITSMKAHGFNDETIAKILNISLDDLEACVSED